LQADRHTLTELRPRSAGERKRNEPGLAHAREEVGKLGPLILIIGAVVIAVIALKFAWENNFLGIRDIAESVGAQLGKQFEEIGAALGALGEAFGAVGRRCTSSPRRPRSS
jgi:hypothetical protein